MSELTVKGLEALGGAPSRRSSLSRRRPGDRTLKTAVILAAVGGLTVTTAVMAVIGLGGIAHAVGTIGWRGLATLVLCTAPPLVLLGAAWFLLARDEPPARLPVFVWSRLIRDASGELLPFSHVGGFFFGARAAILRGVASRTAFSTSVADVTAELIAQLVFTGLGLALLTGRMAPGSLRDTVAGAALGGLVVSIVAVVAFVVLQRRGGPFVERLTARFLPGATARTAEFGAALQAIYAAPLRFAGASAVHLLAWIASGLGSWAALRVVGVDIDPIRILALESLVAAARSAVVVVPMGIGVQEATYALIGPLFGLSADLSLALSLVKRARDLVIGVPALMTWQGMEGARAMGRRSPRLTPEEASSPRQAPAL